MRPLKIVDDKWLVKGGTKCSPFRFKDGFILRNFAGTNLDVFGLGSGL